MAKQLQQSMMQQPMMRHLNSWARAFSVAFACAFAVVASGFFPNAAHAEQDATIMIGGETYKVGVLSTSHASGVAGLSATPLLGQAAGDMTISSVSDLASFSARVNAGETFEGYTVTLESNLLVIGGKAFTPVGTPEHPFEGTFDGNGKSIQNLTIDTGGSLSYLGFIGYAGEKATVINLTLSGGSLSVSNSAAGKTIGHVGAIAGHLGGSIEGCTSSMAVSVTNNGAPRTAAGTTAEDLCTITNVGGLVGSLGGDMAGCTHATSGTLTISSTSNVSDAVPYIAGYVGGLVGHQGDESDASHFTTIESCTNDGPMTFFVSGSGGTDRFGEQMYSKSAEVGGIAGYSMGSIVDCSNSAAIQTGLVYDQDVYEGGKLKYEAGSNKAGWGASSTGGIVGSLRGPTIAESASATGVVGSNDEDPGYAFWKKSNGAEAPQTAYISRCSNTGAITGLASVGGIAGNTGSFTVVESCANTAQVEGTRWNKPCPAGIVGIASGDIVYSYNQGRCVTTTGAGYYASGIAGLLTTYNSSSGSTDAALLLDLPEVYGCYVTGPIVSSSASYRSAILVGENHGYIHDNCYIPDLTQTDSEVAPDENYGTVSGNTELSAAELRGSKGIALLNRIVAVNGGNDEWEYYYAPSSSEAGYPALNWEPSVVVPQSPTALNGIVASASLSANPSYSAAALPIPSITLTTTQGDNLVLYQNADYRVYAEDGASAVSSGAPYSARIVGMNYYTGTYTNSTVKYGIGKCNIADCKVTAETRTFNWEDQEPGWVKVIDDAGNAISEDDYEWSRVDVDPTNTKADSNGKFHDYTNVHQASYCYDIKVIAKESSASYEGETIQAAFHINYASLMYGGDDPDTKTSAVYDKVVYGDSEWDYAEALKTKGLIKIKYTGSAIEPTIANPTYLGKALRNGTGKRYLQSPLDYDYRYIYGVANPESNNTASIDCINATGSDESNLACMTIRYTTYGNFKNYSNIFFEITPASMPDDVKVASMPASATYKVGGAKVSPTLTYNGMTLAAGTDYTLTYANNSKVGTATVTITGKGNYSGSITRPFKVTKAAQTMTVKATSKTLKAAKLKKKAQKVSAITVKKARGTVAYKNVSAGKALKKFRVNSKGVITVPKKTRAGTYAVKVQVTAAGSANYQKGSKAVTVKIKVR